jgi:ribosomal protein L5
LAKPWATSKKVRTAAEDLAAIAGQKPVVTKPASRSPAFKVREGMPLGVKVTLRKRACTSSWTADHHRAAARA